MINLAGKEDECVTLRVVSVTVCVYMTGGEGLDEGQIFHSHTKTAEHLTSTETTEPVTERQRAGTLTLSGDD